jgi:hypothetical protein
MMTKDVISLSLILLIYPATPTQNQFIVFGNA